MTGIQTKPDSKGFTLIEVLAAIFLTSVIIAFAVGFYINISDSSSRATKIMREGIRATAILNRVSRDLDGVALMVKPEESDPLDHPWYFVAESDMAYDCSDRVKFISRSNIPSSGSSHTSDLIQIAYQILVEEDESLSLYRWTAPSLPESYEPSFPRMDDDRNFIVAEGLSSVSFRFLTADAEWVETWDSTQLERSGQLPLAIEVDLTLLPENEEEEDLEFMERQDLRRYVRQINLRQKPIDLEAMKLAKAEAEASGMALGGGRVSEEEGIDTDGDGIPDAFPGDENFEDDGEAKADMTPTPGSVAECIRNNWNECSDRFGTGNCSQWSTLNQIQVASFGIDFPWCL